MSDQLEQDQDDIVARLMADEALASVAVIEQRTGVVESDVEGAIAVGNKRPGGTGKRGLVLVVLMPELTPDAIEVPGPRWTARLTVQVIEHPTLNRGTHGTGISAETAARRVRQILHQFANGCGATYAFESLEPAPVAPGLISYLVGFQRLGGDDALAKVATPRISADGLTVTLTCATAGASILYSIDGTYPTIPYTGPFTLDEAATVRAVGSKADTQQSDVAQKTIS